MQAHSHQQDFSELKMNKKIKESSRRIPPRYLQSVHGYFSCRDDHPTRINLSASWDKKTVGSWDRGWEVRIIISYLGSLIRRPEEFKL